jgi:predicted ABC-type ATPase
VFVNADEIARQRWPEDAAAHAYDAARIAAATRTTLIETGRSFIAETVFSHPSKIDLIRDARDHGYTTVLHVLMIPEDLAVQRVKYRVAAGGHYVPEDKVRQRYRRLWSIVADAVAMCDIVTVYDNSRQTGPRAVARFNGGLVLGEPDWPAWAPAELTERWPGGIR